MISPDGRSSVFLHSLRWQTGASSSVGSIACRRNGLLRRCELSLEERYSASRTFLSGVLQHFVCLSTDISVCIRSFVPHLSNGTVPSLSRPVPGFSNTGAILPTYGWPLISPDAWRQRHGSYPVRTYVRSNSNVRSSSNVRSKRPNIRSRQNEPSL